MNVCREMKFVAAVSLITMLYACGPIISRETKYSVSSADKWVGHTIDELIVANGEPVNMYRSTSGGRVLEYVMDDASEKNQARTLKRDYSGRKHSPNASSPGQSCIIRFNISSSDIVESWSVDGDKCN